MNKPRLGVESYFEWGSGGTSESVGPFAQRRQQRRVRRRRSSAPLERERERESARARAGDDAYTVSRSQLLGRALLTLALIHIRVVETSLS